VRRNQTDRTDTEAMLEANRCAGVQPVPVKSSDQQALQALHRVRTQWQATRTGRINVMRGRLREQGCPVPAGARTVVRRVAAIDRELAQVARAHPIATRLQQVPGGGIVTATAMIGAVGPIHAFRRGRDFASWLGLTPREATTGTRRYLGRISKRGDGYLRGLLTPGARAVLRAAQRTARTLPHRLTRLQQWAVTLAARRGHNKAAIALANKLARIIWALWCHETDFHSPRVRAATT
jgi:transposase